MKEAVYLTFSLAKLSVEQRCPKWRFKKKFLWKYLRGNRPHYQLKQNKKKNHWKYFPLVRNYYQCTTYQESIFFNSKVWGMEKKTQNVNNHPRIDWKNFKEACRQLKETFRHKAAFYRETWCCKTQESGERSENNQTHRRLHGYHTVHFQTDSVYV